MNYSDPCLAISRPWAVGTDPVVVRVALGQYWLHDALIVQLSDWSYYAAEDSHDDEEH